MTTEDSEAPVTGLRGAWAGRTPSTIAVVWDRPEDRRDGTFRVLVNGEVVGTTPATDHTVTGLTPGTTYRIGVERVGSAADPEWVEVATPPEPRRLDVTEFGAVGDGRAVNTTAIQRALDEARHGPVVVYVPAGRYVTGALDLHSDTTLELAADATLVGSDDLADYPVRRYRWEGRERDCFASLLNTPDPAPGERLHDITIRGAGTIDANGVVLRRQELAAADRAMPGRAICLRHVDRAYLFGVTVRQSPAWCVHVIYCAEVTLNQVAIHTKYDEHGVAYEGIGNGDGFDPDSTSRVDVIRSVIASQDDCIAIKSGRDEAGRAVGIPSEHVRVTNCRFPSGFGVAVGSEMSGGVRDVLVQDCVFDNTFSCATVKAPRGRGGVVENIRYLDLVHHNIGTEHKDCRWFRGAINIDQFYSHEEFDPHAPRPVTDATPVIRDVTLRNIVSDTVAGRAVFLAGLPEQPLERIRMENVRATGRAGLRAHNVAGLDLTDTCVTTSE